MSKEVLTLGSIILMIVLAISVNAITFSPSFPYNTSMKCGESKKLHFTLTIENDTEIIPGTTTSKNIHMLLSKTYFTGSGTRYLDIFLFPEPAYTCQAGKAEFYFTIKGQNYYITAEITEELWELGTILVEEGKRIDIGNIAHFGVETVGDDKVWYILSGCGDIKEDFIEDFIEETCSGEKVRIELVTAFPEPFSIARFKIFSSEAGLTLTKSNYSVIEDESECVLGLDTLGAKVKRGNIFAIKTINANTGKFVNSVAVTILDQSGELSPIAGISSNIGFFSERLHEDYKQDLIVQLEKEGCEPSTQVILFEKSYDDYKASKQEEEGKYQLVLNISGRYEMKEISNTVKNVLGEGIEGVGVKITKPDNSVFTVQTDSTGLFKFTPDVVGTYKLQGGKDDYTSSALNEIEVFQNKEYLIIAKVDGESKSEYKKNDRITFELIDINNTIIPLNIDATFAGQPLKFINGISDAVTFEDTSTLEIPATEGYIAQTLQLTAKETSNNIFWIIGIIIAVLILLTIIIKIVTKLKGSPKKKEGGRDKVNG